MTKKGLSKTQKETLKELTLEDNYLTFMPSMGSFNPTSYWYAHKSYKRVRNSTVRKLVKLGYIKIKKMGTSAYNQDAHAYITVEGKAAL